ncbi:hypothetical protein V8G54_033795 [Vigna mungo]|uniref:Uncharacterized protein n=1 Tax=Vigna mungo TaxID=3915 RepID=A0AAQ3RJ46_VIGMU
MINALNRIFMRKMRAEKISKLQQRYFSTKRKSYLILSVKSTAQINLLNSSFSIYIWDKIFLRALELSSEPILLLRINTATANVNFRTSHTVQASENYGSHFSITLL